MNDSTRLDGEHVLEKSKVPPQLVLLNFLTVAPQQHHEFDFDGVSFRVTEHSIGWNFESARRLIRDHDGYVDGIVLAGLRESARFGSVEVEQRQVRDLVRTAHLSPVYTGSDFQAFFGNWSLRRHARKNPGLLTNKKVLFHAAVLTPFSGTLLEHTSRISAADPLMLRIPFALQGISAIEKFLRFFGLFFSRNLSDRMDFHRNAVQESSYRLLEKWVAASDVFVTYESLMKHLSSFECFKGKIVVIDVLSVPLKTQLMNAGVAEVIEIFPDLSTFTTHPISSFALVTGIFDQIRADRDSRSSLSAFALDLMEKRRVHPRPAYRKHLPLRRCAFVVHPLCRSQLWKGIGLDVMQRAPLPLQKAAERAVAYTPVARYAELTGARSESTGQEVVCDLYTVLGTPKALMNMNEGVLYNQLISAARTAQEAGALMIGLGAYTKVAGDAGVTVSKHSPIPVTTGNSYSAAATLWAAKVMVERMHGISPQLSNSANPVDAQVMVVGATGSIGRVSSLILAQSFKRLVLVATRPEKLLELREEILERYPQCRVSIATDANHDLPYTDLVVTATSSQGEKVLDILYARPGSVICDCSRPLDISAEEAARRPDVMVIESGEIDLPGEIQLTKSIGLPHPSVYACLAETVLLTMEGRYEEFSLSRNLNVENVREIYRIGRKHGCRLSAIRGHQGVVTDDMIEECKRLARLRLPEWNEKWTSSEHRERKSESQ